MGISSEKQKIDIDKTLAKRPQPAKGKAETKDSQYVYQNSFLKRTLKSISKSKDKKNINLVLKAVSITDKDIYLDIAYYKQSLLFDEKGETWELDTKKVSGIQNDTSARTLFSVWPANGNRLILEINIE